MAPRLFIVIPCYNESEVLPLTSGMFLSELETLRGAGKIAPDSRILFVNDGSTDGTWPLIGQLAAEHEEVLGISLSRNRGHQNALLAGLMEAKEMADITISIDCDGQDDIGAMEAIVDAYLAGNEIVYGVRGSRESDTFFNRNSARLFYKLMRLAGAETVYDHADYRLLSARVLRELASYHEVNLYLRGLIPLVGFQSTTVTFERKERLAGESHYPLVKMLKLAGDGITSFSTAPLKMITVFGAVVALVSFIGVLWSLIAAFTGNTVPGWASMTCIICFLSGVQLVFLGILGIYIGKIYMEVKARPRYIISERTYGK